jgi:hypothetical protein
MANFEGATADPMVEVINTIIYRLKYWDNQKLQIISQDSLVPSLMKR